MNLVSLSLKNLKRRKVRTFLTALGIAISTFAFYSILAFDLGYRTALKEEMSNSGIHMLVSTEGCPMEAASLALHGGEIPKFLQEERLERIRAVKGVKAATAMLIFSLLEPDGKTDLFYGIDDQMLKLKPHWKLQGSWFQNEDDIILGAEAALVEKRKMGDKIYFEQIDKEFKVVGILERTGSEDDGFYYLPLKTAQKVFKKEGKLTGVGVALEDVEKIIEVKDELERIPNVYVVTREQMMDQIMKLIGSSKTLMVSVLVIAITVALLGVMNTVLITVFEGMREFGYMKCVGASAFHIFSIVIIETAALGFLGGLLGGGSGLTFSGLTDEFIKRFLPYTPAGKIIVVDFNIFLASVLFAILASTIAGAYPSLKATQASPMEAIRNG